MLATTHLSTYFKRKSSYLAMVLLFPVASFATPQTTPKAVFQQFYSDINTQRCESARLIRPSYSVERCQQITEVVTHDLETVFNNGANAVMLISMDIYASNAKSYFSGYVRLENSNSEWKIIGPYKSKESYTLAEYVNDYLPVTENIPADVLEDAPALISPPLEVDTAIDPIVQKYLSGTQALEGNYNRLLNEMRATLPEVSQGQILLIDRSRLTLYLYDQNNLLLGFYPILTLTIEQVPNGLFQLANIQQTESTENTPVHLNHLQSIDKAMNNTGDNYYIRELLDTDTNQSLVLSPIDLSKLQKLLKNGVIAYLGN